MYELCVASMVMGRSVALLCAGMRRNHIPWRGYYLGGNVLLSTCMNQLHNEIIVCVLYVAMTHQFT